MNRPAVDDSPTYCEFGLSAYSFNVATEDERPSQFGQLHTQLELEMVLVEEGAYVLRFADRDERIDAGEIGVYWGGIPHRGCGQAVGTTTHVAQIPIVQVLSWARSAALVNRLLDGHVLRGKAFAADLSMFPRWTTDLAIGYPRSREIVELEMQARLRRFFQGLDHVGSTSKHGIGATTAAGVAIAIRFVLRNFTERITVDDIATAVGWHRAYLMDSFHHACGLTIWDYVTRVRLAEARRLLKATDLSTLAICQRAGFASTSRMYEAFHRCYDITPSTYRGKTREERLPCPTPLAPGMALLGT